MKIRRLLFTASFFTACNSGSVQNTGGPYNAGAEKTVTSKAVSKELCFLRTEGKKDQDTLAVQLVIAGENVTGKFCTIPTEKDARIGILTAVKKGDLIKGTWKYMQEGMDQQLPVEFKLSGNALLQKEYSYDPKTGAETISDNAPFSRIYRMISCSRFPQRK